MRVARRQVEQRGGLLSERPLAGGPSRSHEGPSEEDPGAAHGPLPLRGQGPLRQDPPPPRDFRRPDQSQGEADLAGAGTQAPARSVIARGVLGVDDERDDDGTCDRTMAST